VTRAAPSSFEAYLAKQPAEHQALLRDLRARVLALAPTATDAISYAMPALQVGGKGLIWFASWKRHCSVYPVGGDFIAAHPELAGYGHTDKGALHFSAAQPLSDRVVRDLIEDRLVALEDGAAAG
jgi:uncharacterized protein YdhG (YjbR/CyaY superfamily)